MIKKVLTIAGSDCSGGAGIQADMKTITVHKMYAMSVITALTAQNTQGVSDILEVDPDFTRAQLDSVFTDIFPDSVKIGMVSNSETVEAIAEKLKQYNAKNIVLDPVMVATSGSNLMKTGTIVSLCENLFPLATLITPNIPEAEVLSERKIENTDDMVKSAEIIYKKYKVATLLKGGHSIGDATDLLYKDSKATWFSSERINNPNTHGTGCTLSSAIACNLAKGLSVEESVKNAKEYLTGALRSMLDLGKGSGPVDHVYKL